MIECGCPLAGCGFRCVSGRVLAFFGNVCFGTRVEFICCALLSCRPRSPLFNMSKPVLEAKGGSVAVGMEEATGGRSVAVGMENYGRALAKLKRQGDARAMFIIVQYLLATRSIIAIKSGSAHEFWGGAKWGC